MINALLLLNLYRSKFLSFWDNETFIDNLNLPNGLVVVYILVKQNKVINYTQEDYIN